MVLLYCGIDLKTLALFEAIEKWTGLFYFYIRFFFFFFVICHITNIEYFMRLWFLNSGIAPVRQQHPTAH